MKLTLQFKAIFIGLVTVFSSPAFAADAGFSGNAGVVSKYIYRGGVENNDLTAQGGVEYTHQSGIRVGYWGSTLDYNPAREEKATGFEHDVYVGYGQKLTANWSYRLQGTAYIYHDANKVTAAKGEQRDITTYDVTANLIYKNLTLGTTVVIADASATNAGDTYFSAAYSHPLANDFSLNTSIGATLYNGSRDDQIVTTTKDFAVNEARLGVSKQFANTGLVASVDYIYGGENRLGEDFKDHLIFGLNYQF